MRVKMRNDKAWFRLNLIFMDKKISVIIPIYNAEKFLKQTLECVCCQTFTNLEIICVLDCPTDSSQNIINEMAKTDNRIKIVAHSQNLGPAASRNTGVKYSTGVYLHFMDSDDLISSDFYEIMISSAEKNDADVAACSVFYEKKKWKSIRFKKTEVLTETNEKIKKTEVVIRGWSWRYLIKKVFWIKQNFSFPDLKIMEDTPVMISMIYFANKVVLCPNAVYFYKNRENSILNKKYDPIKEKQQSEQRQISRKMCSDFLREKNIRRPNKLLYDIRKFLS